MEEDDDKISNYSYPLAFLYQRCDVPSSSFSTLISFTPPSLGQITLNGCDKRLLGTFWGILMMTSDVILRVAGKKKDRG